MFAFHCLPFPDKNTWSILHTQGALVQGGYGHSSVFDHITRALYVHGGYKAFSANKYRLADDLYRYNVDTQMWWVLFLELSLSGVSSNSCWKDTGLHFCFHAYHHSLHNVKRKMVK